MAPPQNILELPIAVVHQNLRDRGVDLDSFFDEDVKPRQPPDSSNSERKLLTTQRPTRTLNPYDYAYAHAIIRGTAALVEHTNGDLRRAQTAVREAIRRRKTNRGILRLVIEVLPQDLDRAIVILGGVALRNNNNNKRDAESPAPGEPTPKHQRCSDPGVVKPKVVDNLAKLPLDLRHLLRSLSQIKRVSKPEFPVEVQDNEPAAFSDLTIAMSAFRYTADTLPPFTDPQYDDEFENERLHARTGLAISDDLKDLFMTPLTCCSKVDDKETDEEEAGEEGAGEEEAGEYAMTSALDENS